MPNVLFSRSHGRSVNSMTAITAKTTVPIECAKNLLGQDQLALLGPAQPVDLAIVLDPDLVATSSQGLKADDLGQRLGVHFEGDDLRVRVSVCRISVFWIWSIGRPCVHISHV